MLLRGGGRLEWVDVLVQAASAILALLLLTSFFFLGRLLRGSAFSRGLSLFFVGTLLLVIRPSVLILLSFFDAVRLFSWLDVATTAVFAAGLLLIKGPLERLVGEALDRSVVRQLNLEEDSSM